jgi:hypothetical protein
MALPGRRSLGRMRAGVVFVVALCVGAAAAHGEGDEGQFIWRPSLRTTALVDDNVLYEDGSGRGSVGFWVAPRVELGYRSSALDVGADLGVDLRRYLDESDALAAELYRAVGWAEVGLRSGLSLRVSNAFVPQALRLGLPDDEGRNLVQTNRTDAGLRWWRELSGGRELEAGFVASYFLSDDYAEALPLPGGGFAVDPDFRSDYAQALGFVEFQAPLGEWISSFVRTQAAYRDFTHYSPATHGNLSLLMGVRSSRVERLDLELAGGAGAISFDGFGDALRALGRLRVRYRFDTGLSLWLAVQHLLTPDLVGQDVHQTHGELGAEQRLGAATAGTLRLFATRFDREAGGAGVQRFGAVELGLRRQLTRHIQAAVSYRHWLNRGGALLDDFEQNRVALEFGFRL